MTRHELRTPRLLLRAWRESDLEPFAAMNADPAVMRWFPAPLDRAESDAMVERMEAVHDRLGFGLWAVEVLGSVRGAAPFVGFVGLSAPRFELPVEHADPCIEVGWRLARPWWGLGIATEAATESLRFAFDEAGLPEVLSWTVPPNLASQAVMQRLGMRYSGVFEHPLAEPGDWWSTHVLYRTTVDDRPRTSD
jgi:ribosomal-protein-alanine N-acetyltransferase